MNDFVLRGFCQKCEYPIVMNKKGEPSHYDAFAEKHGMSLMMAHIIVPVWHLSPKQMTIISLSKRYKEHYGKTVRDFTDEYTLACFVEDNPFLVAKILKKARKVGKE